MSDKKKKKAEENWKQMEQNIQVMYAWKIYSPITILFRFFCLHCCFSLFRGF